MRISDWSSDVCSSDLLCKEGKGHAPRFACPYHNWTYDREGQLVGISGKDKFGAEVGEDLGLTELPAIEAAGVIWGAMTPGATFDINDWLGDMRAELEILELSGLHLFEQRLDRKSKRLNSSH